MALETRRLQTCELFFSIQGESSFAGLPCVFIRLAGCNLRCTYCDARYSYEEEGVSKTIAELLDFTALYPDMLVEVTGGEPLVQADTVRLLEALLEQGRSVLLETNGSLSLAKVPAAVVKIVDVKCPDSGMSRHFLAENLNHLQDHDELKFVLCSQQDYRWSIVFIERHHLWGRKLLFSAVPDSLSPTLLADWLLADQLPVRLQLQLHKILWPDKIRGK
ncbi:MAG: radical SAM protein [Deltaproteobacteria bacterium]